MMSISLKVIFIVILFYSQPSSSDDDDESLDSEEEAVDSEEELHTPGHELVSAVHAQCDKCNALDNKMIILIAILGTVLAAMLVLLPLVISLHVKLSNAMKAGKGPPAPLSANSNLDRSPQARINTCVTSDPLKLCEECRIYRNFDSLPPCFCYKNEGL
ncbi:protein FAM24B-like [Tamandua tetradactyla]|uniref:protein FAM24B-like n=1 Tax=Tamandua tetradactyla TaxID=48850 RepID=UPI004053A7E1